MKPLARLLIGLLFLVVGLFTTWGLVFDGEFTPWSEYKEPFIHLFLAFLLLADKWESWKKLHRR